MISRMPGQFPYFPDFPIFLLTSASGMQVSSIAIRTGTVQNAESDCRAVMEICDKDGHCCQTTPNGKGLDHPGKDRRSGQTDIYTSTAVLGNCAEVNLFLV